MSKSKDRRRFKVREPSAVVPDNSPVVEMYEYYSITREKEWTIVKPKVADDGVKVYFNSSDALVILAHCIEPVIIEARKKIELKVPESGWYESFSACNIDTSEAFEVALDIALCVERDENVEGGLLLIVTMVAKERPFHEFSTLVMFGKRSEALHYLSTLKAQTDLMEALERLLNNFKA